MCILLQLGTYLFQVRLVLQPFSKLLDALQGFFNCPVKYTRCKSFGDEITKSTKQSLQFFLESLNLSKTDI